MRWDGTIPLELERQMTPAVRAFVQGLLARMTELDERVAELQREIAALRKYSHGSPDDDSKGTSTVSSQVTPNAVAGSETTANAPSGSGTSTTPETPSTERPKKKQGGQPGHPKHSRPLRPTAECNQVVPLHPEVCRRCGNALAGNDPEPLRKQVLELSEIKLDVTEYQLHRRVCSCCGTSTCATLPDDVVGEYGPRLAGFITLMMCVFRLSKRRIALFCQLLFEEPISPGTVIKLQNQATEALRPCYNQLVQALCKQARVNPDETPTKQQSINAWLWVVVAATFTVFTIRLTKAAVVIRELLGEAYRGLVTSDRAKMYLWLMTHQWCWAHLKRDFERMAARPERGVAELGQQLVAATSKLFDFWQRRRDGTLTFRAYANRMGRLRREVRELLERGSRCAHHGTVATCTQLLKEYDNLWLFVYWETDPTNNAAERALRHAVIWRALSFGTQSDAGSRFVETTLSIVETCRQQQRNVYAFIVESITRYRQHRRPLSLLKKTRPRSANTHHATAL